MLTLLYLLSMITAPTADACTVALADSPNLAGIAIDYAEACAQADARDRLSLRVVHHPAMRLAAPEWAFFEMDHQPDLDAETLASIGGPRVNPFAADDYADPFAEDIQ